MISENVSSLVLNQSSFQDFQECPRRFELRFLNEAFWPAAPSSPLSSFEKLTEKGNQFHQLCHQFFLGIEPDLITSTISDPDILQLWESFLPFGRTLLKYPTFSEQILRIPFEGQYLIAKFDLIVQLSDTDYLIIDWKTASQKPARTILADKVQTFLYPFIFQQSGNDLFPADEILPSFIKMQYWYPLSSTPEEIFPYSDAEHLQVKKTISDLLGNIENLILSGDPFPLTDDQGRCNYCVYRSFCERGHQTRLIPPGSELENIDLSNTHFDLEMIVEVEF